MRIKLNKERAKIKIKHLYWQIFKLCLNGGGRGKSGIQLTIFPKGEEPEIFEEE